MNKKPKIGLALGGGASYGMSHIGVLQAFIENGIDIDYIIGTSAGAIVGALYSTGYDLNQFALDAIKFKNKDIAKINFFSMFKNGLLSDKKVMKLFRYYLGDKKIEDCKCKFTAVATDINSGKAQYISKGDISKAVRASISIPGIFAPVKYEDKLLVDGSMSNNIPYDYLKRKGVDIIIAVDVCGNYVPERKPNNIINVLCQAMECLQVNKEQQREKCYDFKIQVNNYGGGQMSLDSDSSKNMIIAGREKANEVIPSIKKLIELRERKEEKETSLQSDELIAFYNEMVREKVYEESEIIFEEINQEKNNGYIINKDSGATL